MHASRNTPSRLFVASAVTLTLAAPAIRAAEAEDTLAEVTVTAERRSQNLQDVPISASVFTGETLDRLGVTDLNDIQTVAPSIAINVVNRSTFVNIRGVGIAQSAPTSSPGVAYLPRWPADSARAVHRPVVLRHRLHRGAARSAGHADRPELNRWRNLRAYAQAGLQQVLGQRRTDLRQLRLDANRRRREPRVHRQFRGARRGRARQARQLHEEHRAQRQPARQRRQRFAARQHGLSQHRMVASTRTCCTNTSTGIPTTTR